MTHRTGARALAIATVLIGQPASASEWSLLGFFSNRFAFLDRESLSSSQTSPDVWVRLVGTDVSAEPVPHNAQTVRLKVDCAGRRTTTKSATWYLNGEPKLMVNTPAAPTENSPDSLASAVHKNVCGGTGTAVRLSSMTPDSFIDGISVDKPDTGFFVMSAGAAHTLLMYKTHSQGSGGLVRYFLHLRVHEGGVDTSKLATLAEMDCGRRTKRLLYSHGGDAANPHKYSAANPEPAERVPDAETAELNSASAEYLFLCQNSPTIDQPPMYMLGQYPIVRYDMFKAVSAGSSE